MSFRSSGVLAHISSLPSPFGTGVFGKETKEFIKTIKDMGFKKWQVLPLGPLDKGNSPYAGDSAFAGNGIFIDPRILYGQGLISKQQLDENIYQGTSYIADYGFALDKRDKTLRFAYENFLKQGGTKKLEGFCDANPWAKVYAKYKGLKERFLYKPWWQWGEYADYNTVKDKDVFESGYYLFVQYIFLEQWLDIKKYANDLGIGIIGDVPLYVAKDSCDLWSRPDIFAIDSTGYNLTKQAGVPPDYFCPQGQLWGNPIYDWDKLKQENYKWWTDRILHGLDLYDIIRIDHFRGFASYWAIDPKASSAKQGRWEQGPGMELFNEILKLVSKDKFIAEDLGAFGEDVVQLLNGTGFPCMRVIQFAFSDPEDRECVHLPHNYPKNAVAYTGTHDNNTLLGWLWEISSECRRYATDYCGYMGKDWGVGGYKSECLRSIMQTLWQSNADTVIIPLQDLCGFGCDTRMNVPGVEKGNWRFRVTAENICGLDKDYFRYINKIYKY